LAASGSTRAFSRRSTSPPERGCAAVSKPRRKWNPKSLLDLNGPAAGVDKIAPLVAKGTRHIAGISGVIHWTSDSADAEVFHAIPLTGPSYCRNQGSPNQNPTEIKARQSNQQLMGVLLVGSSRRP
jgi:hypothetical protein